MKYHYKYFIHLPMKMEPIVSSETSAIRTQTPGNYPKRNNLHKICVLISSTMLVWNLSHSKKKWVRYDRKCILVFVKSTRHSCQVLMYLALSWETFGKKKIIKYYISWKSLKWEPSFSMRIGGGKDRQTDMTFFAKLQKTPKTVCEVLSLVLVKSLA